MFPKMRRSTVGGVTLICLALLATTCRKTQAPVTSAPTPSASQIDLHHPEGGSAAPASVTKHFKGSIGSTLGLQMKITRLKNNLSGDYFYQKVGTRIALKGSIDNDGNLSLDEFDAAGKQTGTFKGIWKTDETGLVNIVGNWSKPNSDKKTAFSLHEEPVFFSGGVEIIVRQIKENNKKLKYEIDAEYPQLTASIDPNFEKFNQHIKNVVLRKVAEFKKEMVAAAANESGDVATAEPLGSDLGIGYTVALAQDDLISVQLDIGSYYSGAAHPNSSTEVINFDLKNGSPIRLADLFTQGSKYLQVLATYCINDLKRQAKTRGPDSMLEADQIESGAGPSLKNYRSWTITRKGLGVNFDAYQVAPYAAGPQYVLVPYSALKDVLKTDSRVSQFLK